MGKLCFRKIEPGVLSIIVVQGGKPDSDVYEGLASYEAAIH